MNHFAWKLLGCVLATIFACWLILVIWPTGVLVAFCMLSTLMLMDSQTPRTHRDIN